MLARIVVKACDIAGLSVPQDMAVVGVDNNLHFCENESISISSITLNSFGMGYRAAELIDRCIHGKGRNGQIVAVGGNELLRRASTRRFQKADARVTRAVEYIRKSACDGITPADVVREMGCSRRLADLRFREVVEHSILDEIHSVKIDRVKSLLRDSCRQCAALPDMCGYSSLADLCRDFKRRTGKTLREWRKDNEQGIAVIAKL